MYYIAVNVICNLFFIYVLMKECVLKTARRTSDIESGEYFSLQLFRSYIILYRAIETLYVLLGIL